MYQRIEIMIDLSPENTHRCSPFFHKNRNAFRLAVIALHSQRKYAGGAASARLPFAGNTQNLPQIVGGVRPLRWRGAASAKQPRNACAAKEAPHPWVRG
jgi:hypothetical protein